MSLLDFGPIYTTTGNISQITYAQKSADSGDTCIAIKSKYGIVMAAEKPKNSQLYISESDERIKKVSNNVSLLSSGLITDAVYIQRRLKDAAMEYKKAFEEDITFESVKNALLQNVHVFTRYMGVRALGANFLTAVHKNNEFKLLTTDCSGKTSYYKANCLGRSSRRAKTELEKLEMDDMSVEDLINNAVRIIFMCYDPSKDKEFDIEIGVMSVETHGKLRKLSDDEVSVYMDKYRHISVDDEN